MNEERFQLTCPNCKHEFNYDRNYLNRKIDELGKEIWSITHQISDYKEKNVDFQENNKTWYVNAKKAFQIKSNQLKELKNFRKIAEHRKKDEEFQIFKNLVKEIYGEDEFIKICRLVDENMKAYNISDMAKVDYTRAKGKSVTSINKI